MGWKTGPAIRLRSLLRQSAPDVVYSSEDRVRERTLRDCLQVLPELGRLARAEDDPVALAKGRVIVDPAQGRLYFGNAQR